MKLVTLILLLLIAIHSAWGQDYYINIESNDTTIITEPSWCNDFDDETIFSVALLKHFSDSDTRYFIQVSLSEEQAILIPEGARAYWVLDNDSVINMVVYREAISSQEATFEGSNVMNRMVVNAFYSISQSDLLATFKGVKRVRIERDNSYYEKFFREDRIGHALQRMYNVISEIKTN